MDELIWKQDALDAFNGNVTISAARNAGRVYTYLKMVTDRIKALPPVQPEIIRCEDCKYFELDHFEKADGFPIPIIVAHEICMKWGEGCKSSVDGWCFMAERRTDERTDSETGCG